MCNRYCEFSLSLDFSNETGNTMVNLWNNRLRWMLRNTKTTKNKKDEKRFYWTVSMFRSTRNSMFRMVSHPYQWWKLSKRDRCESRIAQIAIDFLAFGFKTNRNQCEIKMLEYNSKWFQKIFFTSWKENQKKKKK